MATGKQEMKCSVNAQYGPMCVCVCLCLCIRFWYLLKFTFIEITGFFLFSVILTAIFYITLHDNMSVKRTFILRVGQTGRRQCPFLQIETPCISQYSFVVPLLF